MVRNNLSEEEKNAVNNVLTNYFQMNSFADNVAYALQCELDCNAAGEIYHQKFAHYFPSDEMGADSLSDVMIHEGVRPVRGALHENNETYENIVIAFEDTYNEMAKFKQLVLDTIELLDYNRDCKVLVVTLESISEKLSLLLRQCDIWLDKAKKYHQLNKDFEFDIHFEEFTII